MTGSRDDGLDATKKLPAMPTAGYQTDAFTDPYGVTAPPKVRRHKWLFPLAGAVLILALRSVIALVIVFIELWAIAGIQNRYMETPFFRAVIQVVIGGALVLAAGILIGGG